MQLSKELQIAQSALEELKGIDIVTLDVAQYTSLTSYLLICTGSSTRHVKSLADHVEQLAKQNHIEVIGCEGDGNCGWVLVDLGSIVIHVMDAGLREFYNLEKLWTLFDTESVEELDAVYEN